MPSAPKHQCASPGCFTLIALQDERCLAHSGTTRGQRPAWEGTPSRHDIPHWATLRQQVRHEEPYCRICQVRHTTEVDHILPISQGGGHGRRNLQGLCRGCHAAKSQREAQQGRRVRR